MNKKEIARTLKNLEFEKKILEDEIFNFILKKTSEFFNKTGISIKGIYIRTEEVTPIGGTEEFIVTDVDTEIELPI